MTQTPFSKRLARLRDLMAAEGLSALLVAVPENRYYLSGFQADDLMLTESSGYLLISGDRQLVLTDFRYQEEVKHDAPDWELVVYHDGLAAVLPELFQSLGVEVLGAEGHHLTHKTFMEVEKALHEGRPQAEVRSVEGLVERLRVVKEPEEIERIRAAVRCAEAVLVSVWETLAPGTTEKEVAWEIERRIREAGAEAVSFPPIVASGPNGALPHAVPTDRRIRGDEPVVIDMGVRLNHYCSDMTRTWTAAEPEPRLREIYRVVREAQLAAQDAVRAGRDTVEIDAVARDLIFRVGYGDCFGHGLGHGVGLAVHEKPALRKRTPMTLEENMVVTIEPGIYLPDYGGVRLENMVRVTATGCEVLSFDDLFYEW